ncbi:MAG TPA: carbohydrate ABC transporter permease [Bacillota bacterium]|nr:carbohydrate ABC transporter permease [Bacillota bacterium]
MKIKLNGRQWGWHIFLCLLVMFLLAPILYAISTSFKTLSDATNNVLSLIPEKFSVESYKSVLMRIPFIKITTNTFFIASSVTLFKIITSVLAAYSLVYFRFRGRNALYFILISTMFIPFTVTMIPNYLTIGKLGLLNSSWGVILPQLADALGIFLLRQSMRTIPRSLIEVCQLDNIGHLRIIKDIVVPLIKPSIISTGIIFFINSWNEYVWPVLILKTEEHFTLSLALQMFINAEGGTDVTVAMAISVMTMILPLALYIIFQRFIINTFTQSGIKG